MTPSGSPIRPRFRKRGRIFRKAARADAGSSVAESGMFCSWRKNPSAPCACARRLHGPTVELLNHLCCLGPTTVVLRQPGLSLAKSTVFGLWVSSEADAWRVLRDPVSGLQADTERPHEAYLITSHDDRRPQLVFAEPGKAVHFSVRLENHPWDSPAIRNMIGHFGGVPLDCRESRRLGAGAWLDEWESPAPGTPAGARIDEARRRIESCGRLTVTVATPAHTGVVRFRPAFIDVSGTVLRLADRPMRHIVHADAAAPGFRIGPGDSGEIRVETLPTVGGA